MLQQLRLAGSDGTFAVFIFADPRRPNAEPVNLQFSIENGRLGLDWVLLAEPNIEDQHRFIKLVMSRRQPYQQLPMDGGSYLRVETGDLAGLATVVLHELYGLPTDESVELIAQGFDWPPTRRDF